MYSIPTALEPFYSMKIGLMSDTHGNVARTTRAAEMLRARRVEAVIHCGDIGSQGVLVALVEILEPPKIAVHAVLGNVDFDDYVGAGVELRGRFADLQLAGRRVAILHGDDFSRLRQAVASQRFDYIFTGHTHSSEDRREGRTRIINPGALHRAARPGVAVLDISDDSLAWIDL
jgi:uncharacterized protein